MKRWLGWIAVVVVLAVVVVWRIAAIGETTPARSIEEIQAAEGIPVDVAVVREGRLTVVTDVAGVVEGLRQSTLRAPADYKAGPVHVSVGDRVRRGQRLLSFDSQTSPDRAARLAQARERYENAKRQYDRLAPLLDAGAISESDLDDARTALEVARADLADARLKLDVVSPIDGVVTLVAVRPGDAVASGDVVAQVAVLDSVRVTADVAQDVAARLRVGAAVHVAAVADAGVTAEGAHANAAGSIRRVALGADPTNRLFRVEAVLANADLRLRPGQTITMSVASEVTAASTLVPQRALLGQEDVTPGSSQEVYVVRGRRAQRTRVDLGAVATEVVAVRSGVVPGDTVVVFGANKVTDGVKVRIHHVETGSEGSSSKEAVAQ